MKHVLKIALPEIHTDISEPDDEPCLAPCDPIVCTDCPFGQQGNTFQFTFDNFSG